MAGEPDEAWARRFEAERRSRIEAEAGLKEVQATCAELEQRLREAERELAQRSDALTAKSRELDEARTVADTAGRAKTAFLANMSHEIRTPVSAVMGYANLIAATDRSHPETREWSKRLQRSAEHLLALLDDVLDLSKIDAGRLDLHVVPTEPTTVLEEVGVLMEPRAVERGLELTVVSETELPAKIKTDPLRLRQILVNLVGNAIKYTPSGQVALHARVVAEGERSELVLDVIDTGMGIAAEDLERLFLPFEQGQRGRGRGGVGLGLDIARRLARMLGGDISVRSEVGAGSTFTLTLPVDPDLGRATTPARMVTRSGLLRPDEAESARLDGQTVLLVDDTEDNRRIVAHFLGRGGARVVEAASLVEAFSRLAEDAEDAEIGLVLTDLQLGDGNGLELVKALRAQGDQRPVVALTADALVETRALALTAGVDDFIVKPIIGDRLVARLAALFRKFDTAGRERLGRRARVKTFPVTPRPSLTLPEPHAVELAASLGRQAAQIGVRRPATASHARPGQGAPPDMPVELLHKFYAVLAERVYAMEEAIRMKERARLRDLAHRVAGAGGAMGHPELTDLGRALEIAINEGAAWEQVEPTALRFLTASREAASKRPAACE